MSASHFRTISMMTQFLITLVVSSLWLQGKRTRQWNRCVVLEILLIKCCIFLSQFTASMWSNTPAPAGVTSPNLQRWTAATPEMQVITRCTGTGSVQGRPWPSLCSQSTVEIQTTGSSLKPNIQPSKTAYITGLLLWKTWSLRTAVCTSVPSSKHSDVRGWGAWQKLLHNTFDDRFRGFWLPYLSSRWSWSSRNAVWFSPCSTQH